MMAGDVHVVEGPAPTPAAKFDYAAMRAAAVAELKASSSAAKDEDDECDAGEDDEECGVKW